jgi:hypothetical protein
MCTGTVLHTSSGAASKDTAFIEMQIVEKIVVCRLERQNFGFRELIFGDNFVIFFL